MCFSEATTEGARTVLVADDDPIFRDFMATALIRAGYQVRSAENGRRALALLKSEAFDAVVTDIYMPYADAIEVVRAMRQRHANVPVIVITGDSPGAHEPVLRFLHHLGVTHFLLKPVTPEALQKAIADVVGRAHPPATGS